MCGVLVLWHYGLHQPYMCIPVGHVISYLNMPEVTSKHALTGKQDKWDECIFLSVWLRTVIYSSYPWKPSYQVVYLTE